MPNESGTARSSGRPTGMLTDRYELTMLDTALRTDSAPVSAVFELFARRLPAGRRYGVVAGIARLVEAVDAFRFTPDELDFLAAEGVVSAGTAAWLAHYRFHGRIEAYPDGELYFPGSPVAVVIGSYAEALVLETVLLSILNHDCAVASAASRMRVAAGPDRSLLELGSRRTHEDAAVAAALAAVIAGFDATSNLAASRRYGIRSVGTAAHASVLAAPSERAAFDAQIATLGAATTLLVDTFDITGGIETAVAAARAAGVAGPGAIRIDSGDPHVVVPAARAQLDRSGATATKIVLSGDLDEYAIADHASLPIDAYGVGTSVVTGSGAPAAGFVYKLVAVSHDGTTWRSVAKRSIEKISVGGRKHAFRVTRDGYATAELAVTGERVPDGARRLHECIWDDGPIPRPSLDESRSRHRRVLAELAAHHLDIAAGEPAFVTEVVT
jgi:nicotinate phosphoribosyltransferase